MAEQPAGYNIGLKTGLKAGAKVQATPKRITHLDQFDGVFNNQQSRMSSKYSRLSPPKNRKGGT